MIRENLKAMRQCSQCNTLNNTTVDYCKCGINLNVFGKSVLVNEKGEIVDPNSVSGNTGRTQLDDKYSLRYKQEQSASENIVQQNQYKTVSSQSKVSLWGQFIHCFKHYVDFNGRARRREYWGFSLFHFIFIWGLIFMDLLFIGMPVLSIVYCLAAMMPAIAVIVRRLHDIGKSGKWYFICCVPIVGLLWFLALMCKKGDEETNQYGTNPKQLL